MTGRPDVEAAVAVAVDGLGPGDLRVLADRIERGRPREVVLAAVPRPGFAEAAAAVLDASPDGVLPAAQLAAYLRGVAAGRAQAAGQVTAESVWSGPRTLSVPIRATAHVLVELVEESAHEVVLMTYSAKPYRPLLDALAAAVARGVTVTVVVETLQGAGSALGGAEPAAAFAPVAGIELWHWPVGRRHAAVAGTAGMAGQEGAAGAVGGGAKMHAKLAVADRRVLFVSSANLTQAGVARNIEAGVLVRGGTAPLRAAEHIAELRAKGMLERLR